MSTAFLTRLKERKLVQWALAYLAGAWLLLQVLHLLGEVYAWPAALMRSIPVLLAVGFLAALVLAWYHGEKGAQRVSGPELVMLAGILVLAGVAVALVQGGAQEMERGGPHAAAASAPAAPEQRSIAVLPFADLSPAGDQAYFSDGLTEELLNALAQVPGLRVAARTSSFAFKGENVPVDSVARVLRVSHVLEGSVRRAGDRLRITAQLVSAADGYQHWAQTYDRRMEDVFAVQEEIARAIVAALEVRLADRLQSRLPGSGPQRLVTRGTEDLETYDLYLKGRYFWNQRTEEGLRRAIEHFERVVEREPTFARAYVGLADAYAVLGFYDYLPPREAYPRAKEAAQRALEIDPTLGEPHATLGYAALYYDWDWSESERQFQRAIQLNPDYPVAHQWYGNFLVAMGRFPEAERAMRRSRELDPLSPIVNVAVGWVHYHAGHFQQAVAQQRETLDLFPNFMLAHLFSGQAHEQLGRREEAIAALQQAVTLSRRSVIAVAALAHAYGAAGQAEEARELLAQLQREGERRYVSSYELAKIYLALGQPQQALAWLERAYRQRSHSMVFLEVDPQLASLRSDPRFIRLVRRVGLE